VLVHTEPDIRTWDMSVDVEALVSTFLRGQAAVTALVGDRVYTDLPHKRTYPLILLSRIAGGFLTNRPMWLEQADIQLDAFGGTHKQAWTLQATAMGLLHAQLAGEHPDGVVTFVATDSVIYNPEDDFTDERGHARPRYTVTFTVTAHPVVTGAIP
jgi:uncharacterized protein DUF3168